jgi:mono/diheme cytochrome c family protein
MTLKFSFLLIALFLLISSLHAQGTHSKKAVHHRSSAPSMARGKIVYANICLACHMVDGKGVPMMNPPLVNSDYVQGDKTKLITIVLNGFKEDVEINGKTYSNVMAPHKDLTDKQISDVLTYVRKSFGNKAGSIKASDVKKVRASIKV